MEIAKVLAMLVRDYFVPAGHHKNPLVRFPSLPGSLTVHYVRDDLYFA